MHQNELPAADGEDIFLNDAAMAASAEVVAGGGGAGGAGVAGVNGDVAAPAEVQLNYRRWVRGTILLLLAVGVFFGITLLVNPYRSEERRGG